MCTDNYNVFLSLFQDAKHKMSLLRQMKLVFQEYKIPSPYKVHQTDRWRLVQSSNSQLQLDEGK